LLSWLVVIGNNNVVNAARVYTPLDQTKSDATSESKTGQVFTPLDQTKSDATSESKTGTESAIGNIVGWIFFYIAQFFSYLVNLLIKTLIGVATYNGFNIEMVKNGWSIVRDVANNFFIVILLVIALGNILRVPNYNRQLLPKLLVMAVLINFSKMFTLIMIDFSQIITLWFANAINEVGNQGNIMLYALGLQDLYNIDAGNYSWTTSLSSIDPTLNNQNVIKMMLFAIILSVVAAVVVAIIIIILVYRMVMLWFLVILSPLAFLLTTFPKGQQYASMWWSELGKYLVVGPVMLFFLYLAFFSGSLDVGNPSEGDETTSTTISAIESVSNSTSIETAVQSVSKKMNEGKLFDFLIIIGLMVGSLVMGQKTGVAGAQWAGKGVAGLQKWGKKATLGTAGLGATAGFAAGRGLRHVAAKIPLARKVPVLGRALGQAADKRTVRLAATKAKTEQDRITTRAQALKVDDMDEKQLRKLAKGGDKYARIAATRTMMQQGMFRDDDKANRADNIKFINNTRKLLPAELATAFNDNTKKYNPGLAYDTVYKDNDGNFKTDSFVSDVRTGKVKAHEMMGGLNETQLSSLNEALAPDKTKVKGDELAKFLNKYTKEKEENEMYNDLTENQKKAIYGKVDANTWERDGAGKLTDVGEKMRDKFNKSTNFDNLDVAFADSELEDKRTFVANNRSDIAKKVKTITDKLVDDVGDVLKVDDFKDRGPVFNQMLAEKFQEAIDGVDFKKLTAIDTDNTLKKRFQDRLKSGLMAGATIKDNQLDKTNTENDARRRIAEDIYKYSTSKDIEKMKGLKPKTELFDIASRNIRESTVKNLTVSPDGSVLGAALIDKIRKDAADGDSHQIPRADKLRDI